MKYYLNDDCTTKRASSWRTEMLATDSLEAVKEAWREWDALTKHDQNERDNFFVESEDGKELYSIKMTWGSYVEVNEDMRPDNEEVI